MKEIDQEIINFNKQIEQVEKDLQKVESERERTLGEISMEINKLANF